MCEAWEGENSFQLFFRYQPELAGNEILTAARGLFLCVLLSAVLVCSDRKVGIFFNIVLLPLAVPRNKLARDDEIEHVSRWNREKGVDCGPGGCGDDESR